MRAGPLEGEDKLSLDIGSPSELEFGRGKQPAFSFPKLKNSSALPEKSFALPIFSFPLPEKSSALPEKSFLWPVLREK